MTMPLQTYIKRFMPYLSKFSDPSFIFLLFRLTESQLSGYPELLLNLTEIPYKITNEHEYIECIAYTGKNLIQCMYYNNTKKRCCVLIYKSKFSACLV